MKSEVMNCVLQNLIVEEVKIKTANSKTLQLFAFLAAILADNIRKSLETEPFVAENSGG